MLVKDYPTHFVPSLPRKKKIRSFDDQHLENRMRLLQFFIDTIIDHIELRSSPYLLHFLKVDQREQFNKLKTDQEKLAFRISV